MKVPVSFRIDPVVKELAMQRAEAERRSFAVYLEILVIRDVQNAATDHAEAPRPDKTKRR